LDTHNRRNSGFAIAAVAVVFGAGATIFLGWIPDDAFICFRYAANLADGLGPVFNPGDRVEGVSNPLWTLLLGALTRVGLDTVRTAVALSLLCAVTTLVLSWRLFAAVVTTAAEPRAQGFGVEERRRFVGLRLALLSCLAVSLPMIFYATSGLETHAELMLLLAGTLYHLDARRNRDPGRFFISQSALLAVALLRPEGLLFLLVASCFIAANGITGGPGLRRTWPAIALPIVVFVAAVLVKAGYYGAILPNTYLAKPGAGPGYPDPLWRGVFYLVRFFLVSGLVLMLPFCAIAFSDGRRRYSCLFAGAVAAAQLGFIVLVGGDVLRFDRFTVPFTPFLLALALVGFIRLDTMARIRSRKLSFAGAVVCAVVIAGLNGGRVYLATGKYCIHDWMHARVHREVGRYLRQALPSGASVVTNEVGAIAYTSGLEVYDMIGLTDATVGNLLYQSYQRFGVSGSSYSVPRIADYLMSKNPDCIVLPAYGRIDPGKHQPVGDRMHPIWEGLFVHPDLAGRYRCDFSIQVHEHKYWYFYFRRDDTAPAGRFEGPIPGRCLTVQTTAAAPD
jgi:hypothetical protein